MKASTQTMRQVWITRHGPPDVLGLREAAVPQPSKGEVLISVAAAGINFADIMARLGLYPDAPKPPCVVGYEVAGEVVALGPSATAFAVGNKVIALTRFGGYSSHVSVKQERDSLAGKARFPSPTRRSIADRFSCRGHGGSCQAIDRRARGRPRARCAWWSIVARQLRLSCAHWPARRLRLGDSGRRRPMARNDARSTRGTVVPLQPAQTNE